jgi:hypothetical protein
MPAPPGPAFGRPEDKLVAGIHVSRRRKEEGVDGRDKPGHDHLVGSWSSEKARPSGLAEAIEAAKDVAPDAPA